MTLAGVVPEFEEKFRFAFAVASEVAVLAQIDLRVEDSRQNPAVLEKVVPRWRLGGAVGEGGCRPQPRYETSGSRDSGGGESGAWGGSGQIHALICSLTMHY